MGRSGKACQSVHYFWGDLPVPRADQSHCTSPGPNARPQKKNSSEKSSSVCGRSDRQKNPPGATPRRRTPANPGPGLSGRLFINGESVHRARFRHGLRASSGSTEIADPDTLALQWVARWLWKFPCRHVRAACRGGRVRTALSVSQCPLVGRDQGRQHPNEPIERSSLQARRI